MASNDDSVTSLFDVMARYIALRCTNIEMGSLFNYHVLHFMSFMKSNKSYLNILFYSCALL